MTKSALSKEVLEEIRTLPAPQLRELRTYVFFLKARRAMDPSQLYFWTKRWQAWEREADADKRAGRVLDDGTVPGLLKALRRR
ncbi:MAG: hypothetical protein HY737_00110 [Candidatus Omnitrophica bacterium]|nr:hypothetical protein [Candidatus Omnitrophota bacterium]